MANRLMESVIFTYDQTKSLFKFLNRARINQKK